MILFEVIAIALIVSLLTGGSIECLKRQTLRGETLLAVLLPLQMLWPLISSALKMRCGLSVAVWLSMMVILVVVLFFNAPGRWVLVLAGVGILMNVLVIGANGAMPVSLPGVSELGVPRSEAIAALHNECLHEAMDESTALTMFADRVVVPGPVWHRSLVSIGDVFLALGLGGWIFSGSRRVREVGTAVDSTRNRPR